MKWLIASSIDTSMRLPVPVRARVEASRDFLFEAAEVPRDLFR